MGVFDQGCSWTLPDGRSPETGLGFPDLQESIRRLANVYRSTTFEYLPGHTFHQEHQITRTSSIIKEINPVYFLVKLWKWHNLSCVSCVPTLTGVSSTEPGDGDLPPFSSVDDEDGVYDVTVLSSRRKFVGFRRHTGAGSAYGFP